MLDNGMGVETDYVTVMDMQLIISLCWSVQTMPCQSLRPQNRNLRT